MKARRARCPHRAETRDTHPPPDKSDSVPRPPVGHDAHIVPKRRTRTHPPDKSGSVPRPPAGHDAHKSAAIWNCREAVRGLAPPPPSRSKTHLRRMANPRPTDADVTFSHHSDPVHRPTLRHDVGIVPYGRRRYVLRIIPTRPPTDDAARCGHRALRNGVPALFVRQ